jgi:hypothetical protein
MCKGNVEFSCRAAAPCIRRWLIINLKQREQSKYNCKLKRKVETSHKEAHQIQWRWFRINWSYSMAHRLHG